VAQEQTAAAQIAQSTRDTEIKKAGFQAEVDQAQNEAAQRGPLAQATALQAVVQEKTRVAELEAQQKEQQLMVDVRKPADAEAYKQTTLAAAGRDVRIRQAEADAQETRLRAEADARQTEVNAEAQAKAIRVQAEAQADATRLMGQAEADATKADAIRARMEAEASGIERRAAALSQNQEAVIAQQIAENLPEIVRAAASSFDHVGNFTVLNGAQGVTGAMAEVIQQAGVLAGLARTALMPDGPANGSSPRAAGIKPTEPALAAGEPARRRRNSRPRRDQSP
jgi:uncharacterized membrane protein YqiK